MNINQPTLRTWITQFLLGLSSGMPLLLVGSTLQAYLTDQKVDLTTIGIFALVKSPYSYKFLWAPLLDRFPIPGFTRRKGWILVAQLFLFAAIFSMGTVDPAANPWLMALLAFLVSFFSATQDIVIDAYRREVLPTEYIGIGTSLSVTGYRVGMIITGAGALFLADLIPWSQVFQIMAALMAVGIVGTIFAPEQNFEGMRPKSLAESVYMPFKDFFNQSGALLILLFIVLYKVGDNMASQMNVSFILEQGYTKTEYAAIVKGIGIVATIGGLFVGGAIMAKIGVHKSLWIFGIMQGVSTALFGLLYGVEHSIPRLTFVILAENVASGVGTAAFVAYMAGLTNIKFTATQYALLSSFAAFSGSFLSAPTGYMATHLGWVGFYWTCAFLAVPGLVVLHFLGRSKHVDVN